MGICCSVRSGLHSGPLLWTTFARLSRSGRKTVQHRHSAFEVAYLHQHLRSEEIAQDSATPCLPKVSVFVGGSIPGCPRYRKITVGHLLSQTQSGTIWRACLTKHQMVSSSKVWSMKRLFNPEHRFRIPIKHIFIECQGAIGRPTDS
jgi:hypothetical protein